MARDIAGKLARGEKLSEDEVQYARDRGIALPDEYGVPAGEFQDETMDDFGRPPRPTVSSDQYPRPSEPGVHLNPETLSAMTKAQLADLGTAMGLELSGTKSEMIAQLLEE